MFPSLVSFLLFDGDLATVPLMRYESFDWVRTITIPVFSVHGVIKFAWCGSYDLTADDIRPSLELLTATERVVTEGGQAIKCVMAYGHSTLRAFTLEEFAKCLQKD